MSILITGVLNCASDSLAISLLLSYIFSGALICSFIWVIFFLSQHTCYIVRIRDLGIHQARQPTSLCCSAVCGGGVREGTMRLAPLSAGFQSLPPIPTSKVGSSGADCQVGGLVYVLGPCGSLQRTLL